MGLVFNLFVIAINVSARWGCFFLCYHFTPMGFVFVRFGFVTIVSPRWGLFSFGLGLLQLFQPDGVGFRSVHPANFFHQQSLIPLK
jgi:hypothetical protein